MKFEQDENTPWDKPKPFPMMKVIMGVAAAVIGITFVIGSPYIVKEGHVGVKTKFGKAVSQEGPAGLQFKLPIIEQIEQFDVRERRLAERMQAATANQLPITAEISMSWNLDASRVLEVYRKYGGPERFEADVLRPRIRQASKDGLSKYQASELIKERTKAANTIYTNSEHLLESYPSILSSLQIENVVLPQQYLSAVMEKEKAREEAAREEYNLQKQAKVAQQKVQTANAERDATIARADGEAYKLEKEAEARAKAIRLEGDAQAAAITAMQEALSNNPLVIDDEKARRWDGILPKTMLGSNTNMLMKLPE
jgi:regulator of protease activity HflC (stomatin/prohibitin superfamily)